MLYYLQAMIGSIVGIYFLKVINPTINYQVENILQIPIIKREDKKELVDDMVKQNIEEAKKEWDSYEISWNFQKHPLI